MVNKTQEERDEITIDQAERILRRRYWRHVHSIVENANNERKLGNVTTEDEWREYLEQSCEVIYTYRAMDYLRWSDHSDAGIEELGIEAFVDRRGNSINWEGLATWALRADVMEVAGKWEEEEEEEEENS